METKKGKRGRRQWAIVGRSIEESKRIRRQRFVWLAIAFSILLVGAAVAWKGPELYARWRERRIIATARHFLANDDIFKASLSARNAYAANPNSLPINRLMADVAERARSRQAVFFSRRVAELQPDKLENFVAWANAALLHKQAEVANAALEATPARFRDEPAYLEVLGSYHLVMGDGAKAAETYRKLLARKPDHSSARLNLALLDLRSPNTASRDEAKRQLNALLDNPKTALEAHRALGAEAFAERNAGDALRLSEKLVSLPGQTLADRMLRLRVLRAADSPDTNAYFAALQRESASDPAAIFELAKWLLQENRAQEAQSWLLSLPQEVATTQPVPMVIADTYAALGDWAGLEARILQENWSEVETLRILMLARAAKEQGDELKFSASWTNSLLAAGGQIEMLVLLAQNTRQWGWQPQFESTLWTVVRQFPSQSWAQRLLFDHLQRNANSHGLAQFYQLLMKHNAADETAKRSWAFLNQLLGVEPTATTAIATELYKANPNHSGNVWIYAFALHQEGETEQALELLESRPSQERDSPNGSALYGILLDSVGRSTDALGFLKNAQAYRLVPELAKMVASHMQKENATIPLRFELTLPNESGISSAGIEPSHSSLDPKHK